jgi:hypothetical protein
MKLNYTNTIKHYFYELIQKLGRVLKLMIKFNFAIAHKI